MKLGIVVPLKSKKVSRDWGITVRALMNTVCSVLNQSNQSFELIIVGHELPSFLHGLRRNQNLLFHSYNELEVPEIKNITDLQNKMRQLDRDKYFKVTKGVYLLKEMYPEIDCWYALDSDDLLHKNFVEEVVNFPFKHGIVIDNGHLLYKAQKRFMPINNISLYCGSTLVISDRLITYHDEINERAIRDIPFCHVAHMNYLSYLRDELNESSPVLPKPVLAYTLSSGDNISDGYRVSFLKKLRHEIKPYLKAKKINDEFKSNYGIID